MTRRVRAPLRDAAAMEQRLLTALEHLLEDAPYTTLSVARLARAAGMARATFYVHFRDKSDLLQRLLGRVENEMIAAGGDWFRHAEDFDQADLRDAMRRFLGVYRAHHAILRAAAETATYDADVAALYARTLDRFRAETRGAVERVAAAGRAHAGLPPMLADVLAWSADHCYVHHAAHLPEGELDDLLDALTHLVWTAVFSAPPAPAGRAR